MAEELSFYDVKSREKFNSSDYKIVEKVSENKKTGNKTTRFFAVTKSKSGTHECWRVVGKDFAAKNK